MAKIERVIVRCYRFRCPECGTGDAELGDLAGEDDIHCVVCLVEDERHVRLKRWLDPASTER